MPENLPSFCRALHENRHRAHPERILQHCARAKGDSPHERIVCQLPGIHIEPSFVGLTDL